MEGVERGFVPRNGLRLPLLLVPSRGVGLAAFSRQFTVHCDSDG